MTPHNVHPISEKKSSEKKSTKNSARIPRKCKTVSLCWKLCHSQERQDLVLVNRQVTSFNARLLIKTNKTAKRQNASGPWTGDASTSMIVSKSLFSKKEEVLKTGFFFGGRVESVSPVFGLLSSALHESRAAVFP